jgi:L,D-transpeptidase YbiS
VATPKSTAQRILDTAVELFAEKGFEQTSIRDITQAAGVNIAAINYHFGSREALVHAVAERYLTPLCQDMERQFDDYDASATELSLEDLLELMIRSMLKAVEQDTQGVCLFMRLVSQAYLSSDDSLRSFLDRRYGAYFRRFLQQLSLKVPMLSQSEFYWRCHFLVGAAVLPLARHGLLSGQEQILLGLQATEAEVFHRLVAFLAAGFRSDSDLVTPDPLSPYRQSRSAPGAEPSAMEREPSVTDKKPSAMSTDLHIQIDIGRQRLSLLNSGGALACFAISTARNGVGEQQDTGCTPRGRHLIRAKIGAGCAVNTVFVGRRSSGEIYTPGLARQYPARDWILSRILWLRGCELGVNRLGSCDSMRRFIYIHGTPDSEPMGQPLSHGCIRMRNEDLIWLFDQVSPGTPVLIVP